MKDKYITQLINLTDEEVKFEDLVEIQEDKYYFHILGINDTILSPDIIPKRQVNCPYRYPYPYIRYNLYYSYRFTLIYTKTKISFLETMDIKQ
jgi:hypothetical protein